MNILDEIEKRSLYYLPLTGIDPAYLDFNREQNTSFLIMPERYFANAFAKRPDVLRDYSVAGIVDLGEVYSPYVDIRFSLYYLVKGNAEKMLTALYKESLYVPIQSKDFKKVSSPGVSHLAMPSNYKESFLFYIDAIEKWINEGGDPPKDSFFAEYNMVDMTEYNAVEPFASRYSKRSMLTREKLKQENVVSLLELADVIEPPASDFTAGKVKFIWNDEPFSYPIKPSYFHVGRVMNLQLQKGDILFCYGADKLQINYIPDDFSEPIYCPSLTTVVRPHKDVSSDYLFLFLSSETGTTVIQEKIRGSIIQHLKKSEIERLPVIKPKRGSKSYRQLFELNYLQQQVLDVFSSCYQKNNTDTIEDLLNEELSRKALKCRNKLARDIIVSDFEEVKACFLAGAYKATLIMAGSVLEAFLIDWLSEMDGKDYFSEPIVTLDGKEAVLSDYIDMINLLKRPAWMQDAKNAHFIRKKRNLVHAKLCLKSTERINEQLCKKVIRYLAHIIKTRYSIS